MKSIYLLVVLFLSFNCFDSSLAMAAPRETSLEQQMESLNLSDHAPGATDEDKLYSIQQRMIPLKHASEFTVGAGANLSGDSFLQTNQFEVAYRFHFNDRWALGLSYANVNNQFTEAATRLQSTTGATPSLPYTISQTDLTTEFNAFYGKLRLSPVRVIYFDQYFLLGVGRIHLDATDQTAAVGGLGLAVWFGNNFSLRFGLKDYYSNQPYTAGPVMAHNLYAHIDLGLLLKGN